MNLIKSPILKLFWMLLSAGLLTLAFPKFNLFILAWIGLVPFIIALRGVTIKQAFWYGWIAGIFFSAFMFMWIYPVAWQGWIFASIFYGVYFGIFALVTAYFYKRTRQEDYLKRLVFTPCAYVLMVEYLKSLKPMGMTCGLLASSQFEFLPILQVCDIIGAFGVSWLVVFVNAFAAEVLTGNIPIMYDKHNIISQMFGVHDDPRVEKPQYIIAILIMPLLIIGSYFYGFIKLNWDYPYDSVKPPLKVSIVQPNVNQDVKWDKKYFDETLTKILSLSGRVLREKPDLIIWPETALPDYLLLNRQLFDTVTMAVNLGEADLLTGSLDLRDEKLYNCAFLISPGEGVTDKYEKMRLFPMGEYNPFKKLLPNFKILDRIGKYSEGEKLTIFNVKGKKFPVLICLESIYSHISRKAVLRGANLLVTITNDGWFTGTNAAEQHIALSRLRAIENRVYMVFAANTGYSAFIDPLGRVYKTSNLSEEAVVTDYVYATEKRSIFTRFGEWFIVVCLILFVGLIILNHTRHRE